MKAAVVTKLGVKKLIDLMDAGARMMPAGEPVVQAAAQVLANIASKGNRKRKEKKRREEKKRDRRRRNEGERRSSEHFF